MRRLFAVPSIAESGAATGEGADLNKREPDGTTALHWAAHRNDLKMAEPLIRAGAKADVVNDYGVTAISEAAAAGSAAMVEMLIGAGAGVNTATPAGGTGLMTPARAGKGEALRILG